MRWKRSRRRGVSAARIALLVVLLGVAGAYGLWRTRPLPPPSQPVGAERIVTPAFDISDEANRDALRVLVRGDLNAHQGRWLGLSCAETAAMSEVYVYTDDGQRYRPGYEYLQASRITATLDASGGEIVTEEFDRPGGELTLIGKRRRVLGSDDAERFRTLLLEGEFPAFPPAGSWCTDHPILTLESCVRGRYYGVVRKCGDDGGSFIRLAAAIDAFARDGAKPVALLKPSSSPSDPPPGVDTAAPRE